MLENQEPEIISFYSYKGGTGRSLLLANTAKFLAGTGKRILVIDLDIEAPGLHYKFKLADHPNLSSGGLVRLLVDRCCEYEKSLSDYCIEVPVSNGRLTLLPAGCSPQPSYARDLVRLNSFFPEATAEFSRVVFEASETLGGLDYILIDGRTGVSTLGFAAMSDIADKIVALSLVNDESREGCRAIMRGVKEYRTRFRRAPVPILAVMSRVPELVDVRDIDSDDFIRYLTQPVASTDGGTQLTIADIKASLTLHSHPELQRFEEIITEGERSFMECSLLREMFFFFNCLIPGPMEETGYMKLLDAFVAIDSEDADFYGRRVSNCLRIFDTISTAKKVYVTSGINTDSEGPVSKLSSKMASGILLKLGEKKVSRPKLEEVTLPADADAIVQQMSEGLIHFAKAPFILTRESDLLIDCIQVGHLECLSVLVTHELASSLNRISGKYKRLNTNWAVTDNSPNVDFDSLGSLISCMTDLDMFSGIQVGLCGEVAGIQEVIREFRSRGIRTYVFNTALSAADWLSEVLLDGPKRVVLCDDLTRKVVQRHLMNCPYDHITMGMVDPVPVGYFVPKAESKWRQIVAECFLRVLSDWPLAMDELVSWGIKPFAPETLKRRLTLELKTQDALKSVAVHKK